MRYLVWHFGASKKRMRQHYLITEKTVIFAQSWCNDFFQDTPNKHAMVKQKKKLPNSVNMHIELSIKLGKLGLDNIAYNHSNILFLVF